MIDRIAAGNPFYMPPYDAHVSGLSQNHFTYFSVCYLQQLITQRKKLLINHM